MTGHGAGWPVYSLACRRETIGARYGQTTLATPTPALNGSGNGERQREKQKLDPAFDPNADGMSVLMARALPILTPGLGKTEP